jgi:tetratricopeptide (TPR) repeat protein
MKQNDWKFLAPDVAKGRGALLESLGKYEEAIKWYREAAKADATNSEFAMKIGRCLRKLNRTREAEAELMKTLRIMPAHGETNLELGLLYKDAGDAAKARTHLQRALQTWANADSNFTPARNAREALSALK